MNSRNRASRASSSTLRNNGGGSLLEATTLTGLFIDTGPVVQVRNSSGRISLEEDVDPGMAWEGPLAVLVNRYSASASEIFAAAIQDYGRGVVIGEPTFGKGTVQSLLDLDDYAPSDKPGMGQLKDHHGPVFPGQWRLHPEHGRRAGHPLPVVW